MCILFHWFDGSHLLRVPCIFISYVTFTHAMHFLKSRRDNSPHSHPREHWYSIYLCIFHSLSTCSLYVLFCSRRDNKRLRNRHLHKLILEAKEATQSKLNYIMNDLEHYDPTIFPFLKDFIPIMNPVIFHHHIQYALNTLNK